MKHSLKLVPLVFLFPLLALADTFKITDIRVKGLKRVSAASVFASLPISVGDQTSKKLVADSIRKLFSTGYFESIEFGRDGNVLVITVEERPSISEIVLEGNKAIDSENLLKGLKDSGLAEGQVFRRATLEGVRLELQRQYVSQGRYGATVETIVKELPRNRVAVTINISEGSVAAIKHINIVGASVFPQQDLVDLFELKTSGRMSWLTGNDKYAREKLSGDLERLSSYYLDRGYLKFNIDSTQVSISPDKETVFISINVTEGEKYTVGEVKLAGELIVTEEELMRLVLVKKGSTFSQVLMTTTADYLTQRLGNEGYTFAKVRGIPEVDETAKTVAVTFYIEPNNRSYVRRINFRGNTKTTDEVLRREMRQMEGAIASTSKIEQSKIRLSRLGFFKEVKVDTPTVAGTNDQIDVEYTVEEQSSGSIGASVGFAQGSGLVLGANVQQRNFMGTGKRIGFGINTSEFQERYSFNYDDPYYTADGVSRGFSLFYRSDNLEEINISSYRTDTFGTTISFGYPISEIERLGFSFGYSDTKINVGSRAVQEIISSPRFETNPTIEHFMAFDDYNAVFGDTSLDELFIAAGREDRVVGTNGTVTQYRADFGAYHSAMNTQFNASHPGTAITDLTSQQVQDVHKLVEGRNSDSDPDNDVIIPPGAPYNYANEEKIQQWDLESALRDLRGADGQLLLTEEQLSKSPDGFLDIYGDRFKNFTITTTWSQSTLNRGRLATRGAQQSVSLELAIPGSDLEYFKLIYRGQYFKPLTKSLTLRLRTRLGYGDGYGELDVLPFYEHFFSGGFGSVRGYKRNTLGPRSTPANLYIGELECIIGDQTTDAQIVNAAANCRPNADGELAERESFYLLGRDNKLLTTVDDDDDPFGGDVLIEGSAEIIFPLPFVKDQRSMQSAFFIDAGNAFSRNCSDTQINCFEPDLDELRYSVGVGLTWITGFGPLTFSLAKALNDSAEDDTEVFQFSLGQGF